MRSLAAGWRWVPVLAWMGLIAYWSGQSDLPIDKPPISQLLLGFQHRLAHIGAYAILALLTRWAMRPGSRRALWSWLLVALFAVSDEIHQSFTPGRSPGVDDWLVDVVAAALALALAGRVRWSPTERLRARFTPARSRGEVLPASTPAGARGPRLPGASRLTLLATLAAAMAVLVGVQLVRASASGGAGIEPRLVRAVDRLLPAPVDRAAVAAVRGTLALARQARAELRGRLAD